MQQVKGCLMKNCPSDKVSKKTWLIPVQCVWMFIYFYVKKYFLKKYRLSWGTGSSSPGWFFLTLGLLRKGTRRASVKNKSGWFFLTHTLGLLLKKIDITCLYYRSCGPWPELQRGSEISRARGRKRRHKGCHGPEASSQALWHAQAARLRQFFYFLFFFFTKVGMVRKQIANH